MPPASQSTTSEGRMDDYIAVGARMNLSFAGCGFLGIYHVGVAACFKKYAPHLTVNKVSGASAGAIAACTILCEAPLGEITSDVLRIATVARSKTLGAFSPSFNITKILRDGLERILPEDAHLRVNGKINISMTRVYDRKNVIFSHFDSKQDLIQAILCSAFIPGFSGFFPPKLQGVRYMDGAFSDNLPLINEDTITVSPFCGESDICPRDDSSYLIHISLANTSIEISRQNLYRFSKTLFPPKPEILSKMCQQGFDDALRFLHRNNLISCARCLAVQSSFSLADSSSSFDYLDDVEEGMTTTNDNTASSGVFLSPPPLNNDHSLSCVANCTDCKQQQQEAMIDKLPEIVLTILEDAIEATNRGLVNWLFKHKSLKFLTVLSLPAIVPADIVYATFLKFMELAPKIGENLKVLAKAVIDYLNHLLKVIIRQRTIYSAKFTCRLAITEYAETNQDIESQKEDVTKKGSIKRERVRRKSSIRNKVNFGFTFNLDSSSSSNAGRSLNPSQLPSRRHSMADVVLQSIGGGAGATGQGDQLFQSPQHSNASSILSRINAKYSSCSAVLVNSAGVGGNGNGNGSPGAGNVSGRSSYDHLDDSAFQKILDVTSNQDALMAYYYMDENNQIKVMEIFDVTDSETGNLLPPNSPLYNETIFNDFCPSLSPASSADGRQPLLPLSKDAWLAYGPHNNISFKDGADSSKILEFKSNSSSLESIGKDQNPANGSTQHHLSTSSGAVAVGGAGGGGSSSNGNEMVSYDISSAENNVDSICSDMDSDWNRSSVYSSNSSLLHQPTASSSDHHGYRRHLSVSSVGLSAGEGGGGNSPRQERSGLTRSNSEKEAKRKPSFIILE